MRSTLLLRGMHLALGLLAPLLLVSLLSCQRAKEQKADLGPEVSDEEVFDALNGAVHGRTLSTLKEGQYLRYTNLRRVENQEATYNLGGLTVRVLARQESEDKKNWEYPLLISKSVRQADDSFKTTDSEDAIEVPKSPTDAGFAASAARRAGARVAQLKAEALSLVRASAEKQVVRTSFHRLRTADGTVKAPGGVASKPGCGGLPDCEMQVKYVRFDLVAWFADDDYQRISYDLAFSLSPPYLPYGDDLFEQLTGVTVIDCRSTMFPVDGRKVYVRDCSYLEDFLK